MNEDTSKNVPEIIEAEILEKAPGKELQEIKAEEPVSENVKSEEDVKEKIQETPKPEKGFAHYVGFALLSALFIIFFFMPGITASFLINKLATLPGTAIWILSAVFSVIIWAMFKLKIKGFKKASLFYIGFCGLVFVILILIANMSSAEIFTGETGILEILIP